MRWKCKFCAFSSNGQGRILQHYKERHGHHRRCSGLVCIYEDCLNTFQTQAELKNHLKEHVKEGHKIVTKLCCDSCTFSEPSNSNKYFAHLKTHLRNKETVKCPIFLTSVLSTFTAHKSCYHRFSSLNSLRPELFVHHTLTNAVLEEEFVSDTEASPSYNSIPEAEWPDPFVIPDFSHDDEFQPRVSNEAYANDETVMVVSKSVKSEILYRLADCIAKITLYPTRDNIESIAKALVVMHPCLREPGLGQGWYCWKFSLVFKMGNYRQRMMTAGCPEVLVNKRKRGKGKSKPVKKSKRGEILYLPQPPEGQTAVKSENDRETMLLEVQKRDPDLQLLDELMTATFSKRRQEIIGDEPLTSAVMDKWPALFCERQVILSQLSTA